MGTCLTRCRAAPCISSWTRTTELPAVSPDKTAPVRSCASSLLCRKVTIERLAYADPMSLGGDMKLRADDLTWREIDGDLVILDLRSSTYLTTNASGTVLIKELTHDRTDEELISVLMSTFGISESQAQSDVRSFVEALTTGGLLEQPAVV